MGLYLVTQIDIADGRILDVNNTVNDQSIFSQVDLSQMSFPNITSMVLGLTQNLLIFYSCRQKLIFEN